MHIVACSSESALALEAERHLQQTSLESDGDEVCMSRSDCQRSGVPRTGRENESFTASRTEGCGTAGGDARIYPTTDFGVMSWQRIFTPREFKYTRGKRFQLPSAAAAASHLFISFPRFLVALAASEFPSDCLPSCRRRIGKSNASLRPRLDAVPSPELLQFSIGRTKFHRERADTCLASRVFARESSGIWTPSRDATSFRDVPICIRHKCVLSLE